MRLYERHPGRAFLMKGNRVKHLALKHTSLRLSCITGLWAHPHHLYLFLFSSLTSSGVRGKTQSTAPAESLLAKWLTSEHDKEKAREEGKDEWQQWGMGSDRDGTQNERMESLGKWCCSKWNKMKKKKEGKKEDILFHSLFIYLFYFF